MANERPERPARAVVTLVTTRVWSVMRSAELGGGGCAWSGRHGVQSMAQIQSAERVGEQAGVLTNNEIPRLAVQRILSTY